MPGQLSRYQATHNLVHGTVIYRRPELKKNRDPRFHFCDAFRGRSTRPSYCAPLASSSRACRLPEQRPYAENRAWYS